MNDQTQHDELPELSDAAITRIETAVFDEIEKDRPPARATTDRTRARRGRWLTGAGIAAAFVVGVLVTPAILGVVGTTATSTAGGGEVYGGGPVDDAVGASDRSAEIAPESMSGSAPSTVQTDVQTDVDSADREIIATAHATVRVDDIAVAADEIAALAKSAGGYVESTEIGRSMAVDETSEPAPTDSGYGWISIRVPSADLPAVIDSLDASGEVLASSTSRQDVTSTAIDLRARADATKASVQRLTELMSQSGSVSELIEAEVALTDRQAQLESYEQQLASLEDQVAMSSLQVQLTETAAPASADPAGFSDGLLAGWNGLVVSLNALVIAIGFLLPWLGLAALVLLVVWLVRRARRNRRMAKDAPAEN